MTKLQSAILIQRMTFQTLLVVLVAFGTISSEHLAVAGPFDETTPDLVDLPEVPPGFEVMLFAREPVVRNPCSMAFDSKGRLFVGMGPQYRNPTPDTPPDSVFIVQDTDGDGVADKAKVFATGFNTIQSLAWHGRDLWVANSPDLTIVRDLDGDDEADEYVRVYTDLGNLEHGLHGLVWAPDGKLYMTKGNSKGLTQPGRFAPKPFRDLWGVTAPAGTPDSYEPRIFKKGEYHHAYHDPNDDWGREGGVLRCDDLGKNLEIVARGLRNPWDAVFDNGFNWLGTDNDQKDGDRVIMPFFGAHFGWSHSWSANWTGADHLPTVPISAPVFQGSGTGIIFYDAPQFPENFRRVFFINDWLRRTMFVYRPRWDGALLQPEGGVWEEFARGAKALFRATDLEVGPDGAIYCLGWGRGYGVEFKDGEMVNEGRIFQIKWKNAPLIPRSTWHGAKRDKPSAQWTVAELIEDFAGPLPVWKIDAQDELVRRGSAVTNELVKALNSSKLSEAQETWTLWALGRIAPNDAAIDEFFTRNIRSAKNNLRLQSIRILAYRVREAHPTKTLPPTMVELLKDPEPRIRFETVQALWQAKQSQFTAAIEKLAAVETDRLTYYSAWHALRDFQTGKELTALLADSRGGVRRAALLALLDLKALNAAQVTPLADDTDSGTKDVARLWLAKTASGTNQAIIKGRALDGGQPARLAPAKDDFISHLHANSKAKYELVPNGMKTGARAYGDRTFTFSSVPAALTNLSYIRTANDDAGSQTNALLGFESDLDLTIFIAHDVRMAAPPKWMKVGEPDGFTATDLVVSTTETTFRVFQKEFAAGDIILGGNTDDGVATARAAYLVIYQPTPLKPVAPPTTIAQVLEILSQGKKNRGEHLFMNPAGANCFNCHRIGDRGNEFAPNLTGLGDRADARHIIESMLEPNVVITEGFNSHDVETDDNDYSGMLVEETDFFLTLVQANGQLVRIDKSKIRKHQSLRSSAMPSFAQMLTPAQAADITVWLLSQKTGATNVQAAARFAFEQKDDRLIITHDSKPVAHFVFRDTNTFRPYFAHVHTADGIQVTRNHPPVPGVDPVDHPTMHPGIWLAFGDISGQDFWRNKATIRHDKFTRPPATTGHKLTFATESTLIATNGDVLAKLDSNFEWSATSDGYLVTWQAVFHPLIDNFTFGDQEEMGFGVRVATPLSEKNGGTIRNSDGLGGAKNAWGKTAVWCDYSGTLSNRLVGITVLTDPNNFRPSWMHSRDYGLLEANPFGRKAFTKGEPSSIPVKLGETFTLRFAAFIHSSPTNEPPDLNAAYKTFTSQK